MSKLGKFETSRELDVPVYVKYRDYGRTALSELSFEAMAELQTAYPELLRAVVAGARQRANPAMAGFAAALAYIGYQEALAAEPPHPEAAQAFLDVIAAGAIFQPRVQDRPSLAERPAPHVSSLHV